MLRVILESPYAAPTEAGIESNVEYARLCLHDSLSRGEAPIASHLLYPQVLSEKTERQWGIDAGHAWLGAADLMVFYVDLGFSPGMLKAKERAIEANILYEERRLNA